jgi:hypothetical protein
MRAFAAPLGPQKNDCLLLHSAILAYKNYLNYPGAKCMNGLYKILLCLL